MKQPASVRQLVLMIVASLIFCAAAETASAQSRMGARSSTGGGPSRNRNLPSRRNKPTVSPYLSLINNAGGTGLSMFNFYNIVRPQRRAQRAAAELNSELRFVEGNLSELRRSNTAGNQSNSTLQEDTAPSFSGRMEPTGHPTAFGDLKGFYADYGTLR